MSKLNLEELLKESKKDELTIREFERMKRECQCIDLPHACWIHKCFFDGCKK